MKISLHFFNLHGNYSLIGVKKEADLSWYTI